MHLTALQSQFQYGPCIALQMDMWTNTHTHVAYGGVNAVTVVEPDEPEVFSAGSTGSAKPVAKPQLFARSEVLDFDVFPLTEHTGVATRDWFKGQRHCQEEANQVLSQTCSNRPLVARSDAVRPHRTSVFAEQLTRRPDLARRHEQG